MKRRILVFVTITIVLALCILIVMGGALANNTEPRILEPMVKTQNCATVFWVQNIGSATQVAIRFKNEVSQELLRLTIELEKGQKRGINLADFLMLPTPYVGWAEITADSSLVAEISEPKCKTNKTILHYLMKEHSNRICTSVVKIRVEPEGTWTTGLMTFFDESGKFVYQHQLEAFSGNVLVNLANIEDLPSGYFGYVHIFCGPNTLIEAEVVALDCEITETPTLTPTPRMTPTMTPTATATPPRFTIFLPLILKNFKLPPILKDYQGQ